MDSYVIKFNIDREKTYFLYLTERDEVAMSAVGMAIRYKTEDDANAVIKEMPSWILTKFEPTVQSH